MSKHDPDFWRDGDPTGEGAPDSEASDDYAEKYLRKPRKRAAIIVTDAETIVYDDANALGGVGMGPWEADTSERLLADLRLLVEKAERHSVVKSVADAAARVRALLPKEDEDG